MDGVSDQIRVLLVDDDPLVRSALTMMLDGLDQLHVVGEATDGDEVLAAVEATRPDVVLMDIRMSRVDGIVATRQIRDRTDPPEIIVLTTFDSDESLLPALRAGAGGFLVKDTPPEQIAAAVRAVAAGEPILSAQATRRLMAHAAAGSGSAESARRCLAVLREREHEVAVSVARGLPNAEIAATLFMSVPTVKAHISHILAKLDLTNRTQLALLVHDAGET